MLFKMGHEFFLLLIKPGALSKPIFLSCRKISKTKATHSIATFIILLLSKIIWHFTNFARKHFFSLPHYVSIHIIRS